MEGVSYWLLVLAGFRALNVVIGYSLYWDGPTQYQENVFGKVEKLPQLGARLFAVWTILSGACCITAAFNPNNVAVWTLTFTSFLVAGWFFAMEVFFYRTMKFKNAVTQWILSGISMLWMWIAWPKA